ncbi:wd repeat-containing protein [Anaeramoeba flamelloides]|uniref:Wd repeat-containing protein n=1 Tax=Anaeramoeba flamelloides TaxID=1746091 RepID=A0AAV8AAP1_9EUKA|nr:wd repeat-containing protein [Anaeramoeba flamelloides]
MSQLTRLAGGRSITNVLVTHDNKRIIQAIEDSLTIFSLRSGNVLQREKIHNSLITSLFYLDPKGTIIVTSSLDGTIRFHDSYTLNEIKKPIILKDPIHNLCFLNQKKKNYLKDTDPDNESKIQEEEDEEDDDEIDDDKLGFVIIETNNGELLKLCCLNIKTGKLLEKFHWNNMKGFESYSSIYSELDEHYLTRRSELIVSAQKEFIYWTLDSRVYSFNLKGEGVIKFGYFPTLITTFSLHPTLDSTFAAGFIDGMIRICWKSQDEFLEYPSYNGESNFHLRRDIDFENSQSLFVNSNETVSKKNNNNTDGGDDDDEKKKTTNKTRTYTEINAEKLKKIKKKKFTTLKKKRIKHVMVNSKTIRWHPTQVRFVSWVLGGQYLISGGEESTLVITHVNSGDRKFLPRIGEKALIKGCCYSNSEKYLLLSEDLTLWVINSGTNTILKKISQMEIMKKISPLYGIGLINHNSNRNIGGLVVINKFPNILQFFDIYRGKPSFDVHVSYENSFIDVVPHLVSKVAFNFNGTEMITVDEKCELSNTLHNNKQQKNSRTIQNNIEEHVKGQTMKKRKKRHHKRKINRLELRKLILEGGKINDDYDVNLKFWKWKHGKFVMVTNFHWSKSKKITSVCFHPFLKIAVTTSVDSYFKIWIENSQKDLINTKKKTNNHQTNKRNKYSKNKTQTNAMPGWVCHSTGFFRHEPAVSSTFSNDGSILAVSYPTIITFWNPYQILLLNKLTIPSKLGQIKKIEFMKRPSNVLLAITQKALIVCDLLKMEIKWAIELSNCDFSIDPFSSRFVLYSQNYLHSSKIVLFDVSSPKPLKIWINNNINPLSVSFEMNKNSDGGNDGSKDSNSDNNNNSNDYMKGNLEENNYSENLIILDMIGRLFRLSISQKKISQIIDKKQKDDSNDGEEEIQEQENEISNYERIFGQQSHHLNENSQSGNSQLKNNDNDQDNNENLMLNLQFLSQKRKVIQEFSSQSHIIPSTSQLANKFLDLMLKKRSSSLKEKNVDETLMDDFNDEDNDNNDDDGDDDDDDDDLLNEIEMEEQENLKNKQNFKNKKQLQNQQQEVNSFDIRENPEYSGFMNFLKQNKKF